MDDGRGPRGLVVAFGPISVPRGGGGVRGLAVIKALAELGWSVAAIASDDPTGADAEESDPRFPPPGTWMVYSLRRTRFLGCSLRLARVVGALTRDADAIFLESAMLLPAVAIAARHTPLVWDSMETQVLHYDRMRRTPALRLRRAVWYALEWSCISRAQRVIAISQTEERELQRLYPAATGKLFVVDHQPLVRRVARADARDLLEPVLGQPPSGARILTFVGPQEAKHNRAAAAWISTVLAPSLTPTDIILLAGSGTQRFSRENGRGARVIGLGTVEDVDAVIAAADLCVAPLAAGAGVKTKVLHYVAQGRDVAGTPLAFEGIPALCALHEADLGRLPSLIAELLADPLTRDEGRHHAIAAEYDDHEQFRHETATEQWRRAIAGLGSGAHNREGPVDLSLAQLVRGLRQELANWWLVGAVIGVVEPTRIPPRRGLRRNAIRQRRLTLRLRSGLVATCRINEAYNVVEIFVRREYHVPGLDWTTVRTVCDVGANVGIATLWFASQAPHARIVAVEPSHSVLPLLHANVDRNSLRGRVTVLPVAAAGRRGRARLITPATGGGSSLFVTAVPVEEGLETPEDVEMLPLSDILDRANLATIDVLKLDCEGAEYDILASAVADSTLRRVRHIVGEYHLVDRGSPTDLASSLRGAGFEVHCTPPQSDRGWFWANRL